MKGGENLNKELLFAIDEVKHINSEQYDSDDYMLAKVKFLSTRPNAHDIKISEDVLREYAKTVLGKWVTAEVKWGDCTTHTNGQTICGLVPTEQDVEFVEADDGYLDAYVDCIISKRYAQEYCNIFSEFDNVRSVSIEAKFIMSENDENEAVGFDIKTITTLGKTVQPSVPGADISITRFSEEDAEKYYNSRGSKLRAFARERKDNMADEKYVNHPVNESKDAIYTGDWDGEKAKRDLIKEKNYKTLAPKVCLRLEDGWEDREITKLGYPIMGLYNGEWRYSTHALASAKAYAEKNDETEVLNKLKEIYKKLDLDDDDGKEEKMSEDIKMETPEVEMSEEEKDAEMAQDENVECAEPEEAEEHDDVDDDKHDDDEDEKVEMSAEEMMAKIAELEADIENRDHIIMDKDVELEELRAYKATVVAKEMACRVDALMEEVSCYMDADQAATFRDEGLSCNESNIDAWANKVKATCFSAVRKEIKKDSKGVFTFGMPKMIKKSDPNSIWEKLENK